jgi:nicotinamide mononucleotide adenylyltransferase
MRGKTAKIAFVGRFCPLHSGHESVINFYRGKPLVIVIGSSQVGDSAPFDAKTMFNLGERKDMINLALEKSGLIYSFAALPDLGDDKKWAKELLKVCGMDSDSIIVSSLNEWTLDCCQSFGIGIVRHPEFFDESGKQLISATTVRGLIAAGKPWEYLVNPRVAEYLKTKILFDGLTGEERIKKYCAN